jgi:hypothetical protein
VSSVFPSARPCSRTPVTYSSKTGSGTAAMVWQRDDWLFEIPRSSRRGGTSVAACDRARAASPPSCLGSVAISSPNRRSARNLSRADLGGVVLRLQPNLACRAETRATSPRLRSILTSSKVRVSASKRRASSSLASGLSTTAWMARTGGFMSCVWRSRLESAPASGGSRQSSRPTSTSARGDGRLATAPCPAGCRSAGAVGQARRGAGRTA